MALKKLKCNVCGNNQFELRYALKNFNVVKCKDCGLVFRDIILTEQEINHLYSKNYFPDSKKILAGQIKDFKNKLNEINKITHKKNYWI